MRRQGAAGRVGRSRAGGGEPAHRAARRPPAPGGRGVRRQDHVPRQHHRAHQRGARRQGGDHALLAGQRGAGEELEDLLAPGGRRRQLRQRRPHRHAQGAPVGEVDRRPDHPRSADLHPAQGLAGADGQAGGRHLQEGRSQDDRPHGRDRRRGQGPRPHGGDVHDRRQQGGAAARVAAGQEGERPHRHRRQGRRGGVADRGRHRIVPDRRGWPRSQGRDVGEDHVGRHQPVPVRVGRRRRRHQQLHQDTTSRSGRPTSSRCSSTPTATARATSSCRSARRTCTSTPGSRRCGRPPTWPATAAACRRR